MQQGRPCWNSVCEERSAALEQEMVERQRLEREAQQAEHFAPLGRLAAGVSHEIRNPLAAVFLQVDLLAEDLQDPSLKARLRWPSRWWTSGLSWRAWTT